MARFRQRGCLRGNLSIYLAQLLFGSRPDEIGHDTNFCTYLDSDYHPFCRYSNPETIRKFEAPLKLVLRPRFEEYDCDREVSFSLYLCCVVPSRQICALRNRRRAAQRPGSSILMGICAVRDLAGAPLLGIAAAT